MKDCRDQQAGSQNLGGNMNEGAQYQSTEHAGRIIFHLVHGTWGRKSEWTKPGSFLRSRLEMQLRDRYSRPEEIEFIALRWGGWNRQSPRLAGAERLGTEISGKVDGRTRQVLIGHSHGGNICLLACKNPSVAENVDGIVCLATPFLIFQKAPDAWYVLFQFLSAWMAVAGLVSILFGDGNLNVVLFGLAYVILLLASLVWFSRPGRNDPEKISMPRSLPFPTLVMRCSGDEASGILGVSLIGQWFVVFMSKYLGWFWENVARSWIPLLLFVLAVYVANEVSPVRDGLRERYESEGLLAVIQYIFNVSGIYIIPILIVTVCVLPMMLLFPIRFFVSSLYGCDVPMKWPNLTVTAEPAPPGAWQIHTLLAESNGRMAHSNLYRNEEAIDAIANWVNEVVKRK